MFATLLVLALAGAEDSSSSSSAAKASFTPEIPPTTGNPFISTPSLPEGTLFIIFGSVLLALIVVVAAWRIYNKFSTYRAAKQDGEFQSLENKYGGPFVDPVAVNGPAELPAEPQTKSEKAAQLRHQKEQYQQGMFYSPTAQVLNNGNLNQPMVTTTSYLPAGYYSAPSNAEPTIASSRRPFSVVTGGRPTSVMTQEFLSEPAGTAPKQRKQRPPSAYLDELLRD